MRVSLRVRDFDRKAKMGKKNIWIFELLKKLLTRILLIHFQICFCYKNLKLNFFYQFLLLKKFLLCSLRLRKEGKKQNLNKRKKKTLQSTFPVFNYYLELSIFKLLSFFEFCKDFLVTMIFSTREIKIGLLLFKENWSSLLRYYEKIMLILE